MTDRYDEYRKQAEYCERMAQRAGTPAVRAEWLRIAERWLSLAGGGMASDAQRARATFEQMVHDRGTGQKDSNSSH